MQINNGHLVADMTSLPEHMADRYTAIPPRLRAKRKAARMARRKNRH